MDIFGFISLFCDRRLGAILRNGFYGEPGVWYYFSAPVPLFSL